MTEEQYRKYKKAYKQHKDSAKYDRRIEFLLTFEEWLKFWQDSGKLEQRGRCKGQYCMARFNDIGPYVLGNIKIILHGENLAECRLGKPRTEEVKKKIAISHTGKTLSSETKQKLRIASTGKKPNLGKKHTFETKKKMFSTKNIEKRLAGYRKYLADPIRVAATTAKKRLNKMSK